MKIIERYLSAYVIDCLFGHTDDIHMDYVYQVLRETGSRSDHQILGKVLDYVRQSDPENPKVRAEVKAYVTAMIVGGVTPDAPKSNMEARFHIENNIITFLLFEGETFAGLGIAHESEKETAIKELQERFPGIQITQI